MSNNEETAALIMPSVRGRRSLRVADVSEARTRASSLQSSPVDHHERLTASVSWPKSRTPQGCSDRKKQNKNILAKAQQREPVADALMDGEETQMTLFEEVKFRVQIGRFRCRVDGNSRNCVACADTVRRYIAVLPTASLSAYR